MCLGSSVGWSKESAFVLFESSSPKYSLALSGICQEDLGVNCQRMEPRDSDLICLMSSKRMLVNAQI